MMNDMPMIPVVFYADDVLAQTSGFTGYGVTGTGNKMFYADASKADTDRHVSAAQPETLDPNNESVR